MPLNYPAGNRFDGLLGNTRWLFDLHERLETSLNPLGKLQKQLDSIAGTNSLAGLALRSAWPDNSLWAASQKLTASALPVGLSAGLAGYDRLNALAAALPSAVVQQAASLASLQATFFDGWATSALLTQQAAWVPQIEALQARFGHLLADLATTSTEESETEVFQAVASVSADVLTASSEVVAAQQVSAQQLDTWVAALERLTAVQERQNELLEKQNALQEQNSKLLARIDQNTTESKAKIRRDNLNAAVGIAGLIVGLLSLLLSWVAYEESQQSAPPKSAPTKPRTEATLTTQTVQATLLPHLLRLMQQALPARGIARRAGVQSRPRRHSTVAAWLLPGAQVQLLHTQHRWACIIYMRHDGTTNQGWIRKKYLHKRSVS